MQDRQRLVLGVRDAAEELGISETKVRDWIKTGKLAAVQPSGPNGKILIPWTSLERFLGIELRTEAAAVGV
jgi:excisionase family DNA binding protein